MVGSVLAEKVAIALLAASLALGGVLAVATVKTVSSPGQLVAANGAADSGTGGDAGAGAAAGAGGGGGAGAAGGGGAAGSSGGSGGGSSASGGGSSNQAASGVKGDKIVVGGFFDMTGPVDSSVERDTVKAYLQKINAQGGVNGRKFEYRDCDSKYDANAAHQCALNLISQHVLAVVGWTAPQAENNEVSTFAAAGIPMIGGLGTPDEFTNALSYPVSISFSHYGDAEGPEAAKFGFKHPALVVISDVPWVATVERNLLASLKASGVNYTDIEEVQATQGSYQGTVFNMQHSNHGPNNGDLAKAYPPTPCASTDTNCPDGVIAALDPFSYTRLFGAMAAVNWHPKILGAGLDKGSVQKQYNNAGELANDYSLVPFLSPYDHPDNPTVKDYLSTVRQYFPGQFDKLDIYTEHAWTAAMVFVEAVRKAGKDLTRASLIQALNGIQNFQTGWSVPLSYGAGLHDPNKCVRYMQYQDTWRTLSNDWVCV